jgi:hypothetical protein
MNSILHFLDSSSAAQFAARSRGIRWSEPATTVKHSQLRIGILALATFFIHLAFLSCPNAIALTYTTDFPLSENPLSEGGNWINGKATGILWSNCAVTNAGSLHYAYGLQSGTNGYDDSLACLTGTWGPTQSLDITLYCTNKQTASPDYEEIEYGLCCTISNRSFTGYLMDVCLGSDTGYIEVGMAHNAQLYPTGWTSWTGNNVYGSQYVVTNGSTIHAAITNNVISIYLNGRLVSKSTNNSGYYPPSNGAPLIGFFHQSGNRHQTEFGISRFTATDGITNGANQGLQPPTGLRVVGP